MKRIYVGLLVVLLAAFSISARQITPDEAISVASDFMSSAELNPATSINSTLRPMKAPGIEANAAVSPYYIFNRGENEGFVIISGDDRAPKILGYSDKGSFDAENLPPQLKAMMEQWATQMTKLSESTPRHNSWDKTVSTRSGEVLLETANWGQGYPYNEKVPIVDGERCQAGCVATAMSIVMKYHNWPETFDWDAMPMNTEKDPIDYDTSYPAIADLMAQAGEAVYMYYTPWESGAHMNWVGHKLQQEFVYAPECQFIKSENFTDDEWMALLHSNLDNGFPIIYNGLDEAMTMNHAFIIDGYNSLGYHVNWGWDGGANGYFVINGLSPNNNQDFSYNTGMVLNIKPDKSGAEYSNCFIDNGYFWGLESTSNKMNISVADIIKDEVFDVFWDCINLPVGFYGEVGIAIVDSDNIIKEILQTMHVQSDTELGYTKGLFLGNVAKVELKESDRLQVIAKDRNDEDFKIVLGTLENPSYCLISGNTPRYSTVTINVGENVYFDHNDMSVNSGILPAGETKISVMDGLDLSYRIRSLDPLAARPVVVKVEGKLLYGTIHVSSFEEINYGIDIVSDCWIKAYLVDLQDKEIFLNEAGSLKDFISQEDAPGIRNLVIKGKMNANDFWYIRNNMPSLQSLDLSKVMIEGVTATDNQFVPELTKFEDDYIPSFALTNLHSSYIKTLILPEHLKGICGDALVNFDINSISIPESVESIGLNVFYANKYLTFVEALNPEPVAISDCIFTATPCPYDGILYVPVGSAEKYRQIPVWQDFKEIREGRMPVFVTDIKLSVKEWTGKVGQSFNIAATSIMPDDAFDKTLVWSSADESIAKVDSEGNVTALDLGETVITAYAADGGGAYAECLVYIIQKPGDSNNDGNIDIADAVNAANFIVGLPTTNFDYNNADINEDGNITVSDVTSIIGLIPSQTYKLNAASDCSFIKSPISGYLVSSASSFNGSVDLSLSSDKDISALQFDICLPEDVAAPEIVLSEDVASSHAIHKFIREENKIRVVLYSASGKLLPNMADSSVLTINGLSSKDGLMFENIFASDACGRSMTLNVEDLIVPNGVSGSVVANPEVTPLKGQLKISNADGAFVAVYALDGTCMGANVSDSDEFVMSLSSGIYILKVGTRVYRVIIK